MRKNENLEMNIISKIRKFDEDCQVRDLLLPRSEPFIGGLLPKGIIDIQIIGSVSHEKEIGIRLEPDIIYSANRNSLENERLQFVKNCCFPLGVYNRTSKNESRISAFSMSGTESSRGLQYSEVYCLYLIYQHKYQNSYRDKAICIIFEDITFYASCESHLRLLYHTLTTNSTPFDALPSQCTSFNPSSSDPLTYFLSPIFRSLPFHLFYDLLLHIIRENSLLVTKNLIAH